MVLQKNQQNWQTLTTWTKKKIEKTQIIKIRKESVDITTDSTEIKRIIRDHYEKLWTNKLDNLDEMDKFLETQNLLETQD